MSHKELSQDGFDFHYLSETPVMTTTEPQRPLKAKFPMENRVVDANNDVYDYFITNRDRVMYRYMYSTIPGLVEEMENFKIK